MTNQSRGLHLGLGPVFRYEWIALSRRWQWYALRSIFTALLLGALGVIAARSSMLIDQMSFKELSALGWAFYTAVIGTQLTLVLIAAPAATAGAICHDRATGTLTHLLVTDLSDTEIVLGRLAARLVPVFGLVGSALPLLAVMTLLGGVDPNALLGAFVVTLCVAVLGCSLAFLFSIWVKRTHEALLATYAIWVIWFVGDPFMRLMNGAYGLSLSVPPMLSGPYHVVFAPYWNPRTYSIYDYVWFVASTLGISAVLVVVAVFRIRPVCTRVSIAKKQSAQGRFERMTNRIAGWFPAPPLDFNPVLWREWHRQRPSRWSRMVNLAFFVGAAASSIAAIILPRNSFAMAWANGLQVSIGMLLLSVTASTALAEERMRGSLDVLMASTLSTREIVIGKWLGTFRHVPGLAILPVIVVTLGGGFDERALTAAFLTLTFVLVCGAAITSVGLAMATWCSRLGRAVAITVSCDVMITVGWLFIGLWLLSGREEGPLMASPFMFAGGLAADLCSSGAQFVTPWALFWIVTYGAASVVFLVATLRTFNLCLGRVEVGLLPMRRKAIAPAKIPDVPKAGQAIRT